MANIFEKLLDVQSELKAPKSQYNSFGKYHYRSAEDIVEAAKPLCKAHGILLTLSDGVELSGDKHYIKATARVVDVADPSGVVEVSAFAREPIDKKGMDDSQITGAASSYARKYALNGLFAIDDTADADSTNDGQTAAKKGTKAAAKPAPAPEVVKCPKCGRQVLSRADNNGVMHTPEQILQKGGGMCIDCFRAAQQAKSAQ